MTAEKELNNDGGNAYPFTFENKSNHVVIIDGYELPAGHAIVNTGMTLRDYFAAKSLAALIGAVYSDTFQAKDDIVITESVLAQQAYEFADAMLAERAK